MAISLEFSPKFDARTAMSAAVSGLAAVAILVSLVVVTHLNLAPHFTYYIAGAGAASSLLIGVLVASVRLRQQQDTKPVKQASSASVKPQLIAPPFQDIAAKITCAQVKPQNGTSLPPVKGCSFITTPFTFLLTVENQIFEYQLSVFHFSTHDDHMFAAIWYNNEKRIIKVQDVITPFKFDEKGCGIAEVISASELNFQIKLGSYLSFGKAKELAAFINDNKAAQFFTNQILPKTIFTVPDLQSAESKGSTITFTRYTTTPLIPQDQLDLLQSSNTDWIKSVASQLNSPVWHYTGDPVKEIILDGDTATVRFNKS